MADTSRYNIEHNTRIEDGTEKTEVLVKEGSNVLGTFSSWKSAEEFIRSGAGNDKALDDDTNTKE